MDLLADAGLWFQAIFLGLVQGLTEFLPVSSSAHLRLVAAYAGWDDPGAAFTAVTQLGTETAVLMYFWSDLWRYFFAFFRGIGSSEVARTTRATFDYRICWYIILGSIPIGISGLLLQNYIDTVFRSLWITGTVLIVFGLLLGWADTRSPQIKPLEDMTAGQSVLFGCWQSLALVPGVSRSGGTITGGRLMGFTRVAATRYSFLLALPAVYAAGLFNLKDVKAGSDFSGAQILVATLVAFAVGLAVIAWLLKFISHHSYQGFVIYRVILGSIVLLSLAMGAIDAYAGLPAAEAPDPLEVAATMALVATATAVLLVISRRVRLRTAAAEGRTLIA